MAYQCYCVGGNEQCKSIFKTLKNMRYHSEEKTTSTASISKGKNDEYFIPDSPGFELNLNTILKKKKNQNSPIHQPHSY